MTLRGARKRDCWPVCASAKFRVAPYSERVLGKTDEISKSGANHPVIKNWRVAVRVVWV